MADTRVNARALIVCFGGSELNTEAARGASIKFLSLVA
jgi:hypothetical protein